MEKIKSITIIIEDDETRQIVTVPIVGTIRWDVSYEEEVIFDNLFHNPPAIEEITLAFEPLPNEEGVTHMIRNEGL